MDWLFNRTKEKATLESDKITYEISDKDLEKLLYTLALLDAEWCYRFDPVTVATNADYIRGIAATIPQPHRLNAIADSYQKLLLSLRHSFRKTDKNTVQVSFAWEDC